MSTIQSVKTEAIEAADITLHLAGLPLYTELVDGLRAARASIAGPGYTQDVHDRVLGTVTSLLGQFDDA